MAAKKKPTTKKKPQAAKKKGKTVSASRTSGTQKKVKKKTQTQKKTVKKKIRKVSKPAEKTARKKVRAKTQKTAKRVEQKKKKPASKVKATKTARKALTETARTASPLSAQRNEFLRKQLIKKREEIVREAKSEIAKYITGEANQLVETALDEGDWSVIDVSADISLKRLETHRQRLLGIDEALLKLREGTYGTCEECGNEISAERLKVMPFAIFCRDCQERREQLEKIEREEIVS
jgi:DnaK suppressor protein